MIILLINKFENLILDIKFILLYYIHLKSFYIFLNINNFIMIFSYLNLTY